MAGRVLFDVTGGIRVWGWKGNQRWGDCVEATVNDLITAKATTSLSTWRRILFRLGFRRPGDRYTFDEYRNYLATIGERPGAGVGTDVEGYLDYLKSLGKIIDWANVPLGADPELAANNAAAQYAGAMLTVELTWNMYDGFPSPEPWSVGTGPGNTRVTRLCHEIAYVRATADRDVIATWNVNKVATPEAIRLITVQCCVFLSREDTYRPEFPAMQAAMTALKASQSGPGA